MNYKVAGFPCIICKKSLNRECADYEDSVSNGVACVATGNYGSTVYDPLNGSQMNFNICDECFTELLEQQVLFESFPRIPIFVQSDNGFGPSIWGWKEIKQVFTAVTTPTYGPVHRVDLHISEVLDYYEKNEDCTYWNAGGLARLRRWVESDLENAKQ